MSTVQQSVVQCLNCWNCQICSNLKSLAVGSLSRKALARCIGLINKALGGAMRLSRCDASCTGWILIFSVITMDYTGLQIHIESWYTCGMYGSCFFMTSEVDCSVPTAASRLFVCEKYRLALHRPTLLHARQWCWSRFPLEFMEHSFNTGALFVIMISITTVSYGPTTVCECVCD